MRGALIAAALVFAPSLLPLPSRQDSRPLDADRVLAEARAALGGPALLDAVKTFTASGSSTLEMTRLSVSQSIEMSCELPDRFLTVSRRTMGMGPGDWVSVTTYTGFNAGAAISATIAPGARMPISIPAGPEPRTPAEIAAANERRLALVRRTFVATVLPLFAASPAAVPLVLSYGGRVALGQGGADVIIATAADGFTWKLLIDPVTHLPARITWMNAPIVTFSTTSSVTADSRGNVVSASPPAALPKGDPAAGLTPVEWATTLGDYRRVDGLMWPHKLTTTVGGRKHEDRRVGKYKINPAIKPKTFDPRK
ncbi:MAG: hypothetical protein M3R55_09030 [Acidobacteriota bacterium]|nr:hypothetical protein [Acidobacteriota bacterium]